MIPADRPTMIRPVRVNREPIGEIEVHRHLDRLKIDSEIVSHIVGFPKFRFFLDILDSSPVGRTPVSESTLFIRSSCLVADRYR